MASEDVKRIRVRVRGSEVLVDYRGVEILDNADVVGLNNLFRRSQPLSTVRINLGNVRSIPSGYFGALYDGAKMGHCVRLCHVEPEIKRLIWYQKFVVRGRLFL